MSCTRDRHTLPLAPAAAIPGGPCVGRRIGGDSPQCGRTGSNWLAMDAQESRITSLPT